MLSPRAWLKGHEMTIYTTKGAPSFLESAFLRTPQLSVLVVKKSYDG